MNAKTHELAPALAGGLDERYLMPNPPEALDEEGLDRILLWASEVGASDVNFLVQSPVVGQIEGYNYILTRKIYPVSSLEMISNIFYGGANGVTHLRGGGEINVSYTIRDEALGVNKLYRVNVVSCRGPHGSPGIHAVLRTIDGTPPTYDKLGIEQEIRDGFESENGLIYVCGKTGSGKSTLMAASNEHKIRNGGNKRKLLLFEDPCEFDYSGVPRVADMVVQHEVPKNVKTYAQAVKAALRRSPSDIMIGESRDYETISVGIEAGETGHLFVSTVHADSVSGAMYRILNLLPPAIRVSKLFEIFEQLRMIVVQKLVPGVNGRRVGLREYLVMTPDLREKLRNIQSTNEAIAMIAVFVEERGQSMLKAAQIACDAGKISKHEVELIETSRRNVVDNLFQTNF